LQSKESPITLAAPQPLNFSSKPIVGSTLLCPLESA
jgi:hypothetical protein